MRVSVIIANRNDTVMLAVTVRSAIEELSAVPGGGEVVIVDNSDDAYIEAVKSVIPQRYIKSGMVRIFRQDFACLFTAREEAARQARGEYIFCVDSHMLFGHNTIVDAVHFMNRRRGRAVGFGSLPVNWLCQHENAARHDMKHLHGSWGRMYTDERRISWKGMPWICRRDWFLNALGAYGCLSEHRMSWGGGDMYLGLKTWLLGFENWSIPGRPVIHIGPLPTAARKFFKYRVYQTSGQYFANLGFLMAFYALGVEDDYFERPEIAAFLEMRVAPNFREHLPQAAALAAADRQRIASDGTYTIDQLENAPPWADRRPYLPFLKRFRAEFDSAKAIKAEDWDLLQRLVRQYSVVRVAEFGSGLSTLLWDTLGVRATSYETDEAYMYGVAALVNSNIEFVHWDNRRDPEVGLADLALVDGADPRDRQIDLAMDCSPRILVHDGYSRPTRGLIDDKLAAWTEVKVNSVRSRLFIRE